MPRSHRPLLLTITSLALLSGVAPAQPASNEEVQPLSECEVIARINSEVILACELEWQARLMLEKQMGPKAIEQIDGSALAQQIWRALLKQLVVSRIEIALLYADFRSNSPHVDLEAVKKQLDSFFVDTEIPRLMEMLGVEDRPALDAELMRLGTSLGERREEFYRTMIARTWLQESAKVNREVTHEQMLDFYHENESDYAQPERVRWEELMVRFDRHPSKRDAFAALARLGNHAHNTVQTTATGEPAFATLAPSHSDGFTAEEGGEYGWTSRGALAAESVDSALFTLPPGQMSPIVEGPVGFHIVRVLERRAAGPTPFSEVQAAIRQQLKDQWFNEAINAKLTALKKSARLWTVFTGDLNYEQLLELQQGPMQDREPGQEG